MAVVVEPDLSDLDCRTLTATPRANFPSVPAREFTATGSPVPSILAISLVIGPADPHSVASKVLRFRPDALLWIQTLSSCPLCDSAALPLNLDLLSCNRERICSCYVSIPERGIAEVCALRTDTVQIDSDLAYVLAPTWLAAACRSPYQRRPYRMAQEMPEVHLNLRSVAPKGRKTYGPGVAASTGRQACPTPSR